MVYSDTTLNQGIIQEIDFLVSTDSVSYTTADKTRNINRWQDKVFGWILEASNPRLQFDDSRYTDLPVATADLFSGQYSYGFDATWLSINRIDMKNSSGTWQTLSSFDQYDVTGGYDAYQATAGTPLGYDILAGTYQIKPTPNYSSTGGLKIWFVRKAKAFTATDTTAEPGFAPQFHRILSLGASYDYAMSRNMPQTRSLREEIEQLHKEIEDYYGTLNKERLRLTTNRLNFGHSR